MEILAALLTAACYWLLVYRILTGHGKRLRDYAGPLLLSDKLKCRRRNGYRGCGDWWGSV